MRHLEMNFTYLKFIKRIFTYKSSLFDLPWHIAELKEEDTPMV